MTKPYPIVPLSFVDGLNDLNNALQVYNQLVAAWAQQSLNGDLQGDPARFTAGLDFLFRPILEGYQSIEDQCTRALKMGMVGVAVLDESHQEAQ